MPRCCYLLAFGKVPVFATAVIYNEWLTVLVAKIGTHAESKGANTAKNLLQFCSFYGGVAEVPVLFRLQSIQLIIREVSFSHLHLFGTWEP